MFGSSCFFEELFRLNQFACGSLLSAAASETLVSGAAWAWVCFSAPKSQLALPLLLESETPL